MAFPRRHVVTYRRVRDLLNPSVKKFLPYARQTLDEDDIASVLKALRSDWLTTGPLVSSFEQTIGSIISSPNTLACSSGTAALHLASLALGIGPGDTVIVPSLTFLATANAAVLSGADVVFCDVDSETGLMGPNHLIDALEKYKEKRPKAVFPVHLNGQAANMPAISAIAKQNDLRIIEDAAHALGTSYNDKPDKHSVIGECRHSDITAFSFHPVKTITTGEGGALSTADAKVLERARLLRNHGIERDVSAFEFPDQAFSDEGLPNPWYYEMVEVGLNYRASDIHCALGLSQLAKLDRFIEHRSHLVNHYNGALARLSPLVTPIKRMSYSQTAWHLFVVHIDYIAAGLSRAKLMNSLQGYGIGTQVHYLPLHLQPYYKRRYGPIQLPGAEQYYSTALSLPLHVGMNLEDVERVADALAASLTNR